MKIEIKKYYIYIVIFLLIIFLVQVNWSMRYKSYNRDTFGKNILGGTLFFQKGYIIGEDDFEELQIFPLGMLHNLPLAFIADFGNNRTDFIEKYASTGEWKSFYKWGMLTDNQVNILEKQYRRSFSNNIELPFIPRTYILWDVFFLSLLGCALGYLVFRWAKECYGLKSGLLALFLYSFSPWMISLSRLITSDLMMALSTLLALYASWKFILNPNYKTSLLAGVFLGVALATKVTAIYILLMYPFIFLIFWKKMNIRFKEFAKHFMIIIFLSFFVLNSLFLYKDMFQTLESHRYPTYSGLFKKLEQTPIINKIPIPLSYRYIVAIDLARSQSGAEANHPSWMDGEGSTDGFKSFYFYSIIYKNTLPELILFSLAVLSLFLFRKKIRIKYCTVFLLFIFFFILIFSSYSAKVNIGGRHISPLFPLMFIIGSNFINLRLNKKMIIPTVIIILCGWQLIEAIAIFPNHTAYFNQIAGGPEKGHLHFKDSNIDYNQDDLLVKWYFEDNPGIDLVPPCYGFTGKVVMNVEFINFQMPNCFYWLKQFKPIDYIGYSWIVYDVDGQWYQDKDGRVGFNPSKKMLERKCKKSHC